MSLWRWLSTRFKTWRPPSYACRPMLTSPDGQPVRLLDLPFPLLGLSYTCGNLVSQEIVAIAGMPSHAFPVIGPVGRTVEAEATGMERLTLAARVGDPDVMLWLYEPVGMTREQAALVIGYAEGMVGKPYNFDELWADAIGLGEKAGVAGAAVCSEQTFQAFAQAGWPTVAKPTPNGAGVTPQQIHAFVGNQPQFWRLYATQNVRA